MPNKRGSTPTPRGSDRRAEASTLATENRPQTLGLQTLNKAAQMPKIWRRKHIWREQHTYRSLDIDHRGQATVDLSLGLGHGRGDLAVVHDVITDLELHRVRAGGQAADHPPVSGGSERK